jgi:phospholipase/carboxylesterase
MIQPNHAHHFIAATDPAKAPLLLLHGSGGNEHDLVPLARELAPASSIIGLRGNVLFDEGYTFFHRFRDRSIDEADITARTPVLAEFINSIMVGQSLAQAPIAIGFSNGAIMAAALLLTCPRLLAGAILFRPLSPFGHGPSARLIRTPVLIIDGEKDTRRSAGDGARLAEELRHAGALVTHHSLPIGHSITNSDQMIARDWLTSLG